jgi:hypothetical protein
MRVVAASEMCASSSEELTELMLKAAESVGVNPSSVEEVVIADEDRYGTSIARIDPANGYTDNGVNTGVGKTIALGDGSRVSIVLRDYIVAGMCRDPANGDQEREHNELAWHCITHEFGHARDYELRPHRGAVQIDGRCFRIADIAGYYWPIALEEFVACVHAAQAMTKRLVIMQAHSFVTTTRELLRQTAEERRKWEIGCGDLGRLAYGAAGAAWYALTEWGKIVGFAVGLGAPDVCAAIAANCNDLPAQPELERATELFRQYWASYPDWPEVPPSAAIKLWTDIAMACGYKFIRGKNSDRIDFVPARGSVPRAAG